MIRRSNLAVLALVASAGAHSASVEIRNNDAAGVGLNDPTVVAPVAGNPGVTLGEQRINVLERAATIWARRLDSDVTIVVEAQTAEQTCTATSAVLASAGALNVFSDFPNAPFGNTWYHAALANAIAGSDLSDQVPNDGDIITQFNINIDNDPVCLGGNGWYYGYDHNEGNQVDLLAVMLHEYGHGIGFANFVNEAAGTLFQGRRDIYTTFTRDLEVNLDWNDMTNAQRQASAINDPDVVWTGQNATSAALAYLGQAAALVINSPSNLLGIYPAQQAQFGPSIGSTPVRGQVVLAVDGTSPANDGCEALTNGAAISGNIALVDRGACTFSVKVKSAQNAGAIAVFVANNQATGLPPMGGDDPTINIPSYGITFDEGMAIKDELLSGPVDASLGLDPNNRAGVRGGFLRVNAPNPLQPGSSISHWTTDALPNLLMEPAITPQLTDDVDLTLDFLTDLGWTILETLSLTADKISIEPPGEDVTYSLSFTNTYGENATVAALEDSIEGDLDGVGTCSVLQVLADQATYQCEFTVSEVANPGSPIVHTVLADIELGDGSVFEESRTVMVGAVGGVTSISATLTANPLLVDEPGGEVAFLVSVENTSESNPITLTSLVDDLAGDLNQMGSCAVSQRIAVGDTYECTFVVTETGNAGDTITHTTTATAEDDGATQVVDAGSDTVTIADVVPSLSTTLVANPTSITEPGGDVSYTVTVANNGVEPVDLTALTDDLAGDLDGQGDCSVPQTIAENADYSCTFDVTESGNAGDTVVHTTTAFAQDDDSNAVQDSAMATVDLVDAQPAVSIFLAADPQSFDEPQADITYTITVTNAGEESVQLTGLGDSVLGDLDGSGSCTLPQTLADGADYQCSFTTTETGNAGDVTGHTITATVEDDELNIVQAGETVSVSVLDVLPLATLSLSADPTTITEPGSNVSYSVLVENTGVESLTLTALSDDSQGDLDSQGTCALPQIIAADGSYQCAFSVAESGVDGDTVSHTVTASLQDDESNAINPGDSVTVDVVDDEAAALELTYTAADDTVDEPGALVTYTVIVRNSGNGESATLDGLVDDGFGDLDGQGTCSLPQTIAVGLDYQCSFNGQVSGIGGTTQTNTLTASATRAGGGTLSEMAGVSVDVNDVQPTITVTNTASTGSVAASGGPVRYFIAVINTGTAESVDLISLSDDTFGDLNGQGDCVVPQSIAPSSVYECSFTETVSGNVGGVFTSTVTAVARDDEVNQVQASDSATVNLVAGDSADLMVSIVSDGSTVLEGETFSYTVTVTNAGPADAINVIVANSIDEEATFVSTAGCSEDPAGQPDCSLGTIASGDSAQVIVTVTAGDSGEDALVFGASVTSGSDLFNTTDDAATLPVDVQTDVLFADGFED